MQTPAELKNSLCFVIFNKAMFSTQRPNFGTPVLRLTLTFVAIAASTGVVDLVSRTSIGTDEWLDCGTDGRCLYHCAIGAGSTCAVVHTPCLAILEGVKNRHTRVFQHAGLYSFPVKMRTKFCQTQFSGFFLQGSQMIITKYRK